MFRHIASLVLFSVLSASAFATETPNDFTTRYENKLDVSEASNSPYTLIQAVGKQLFTSVADAKTQYPGDINAMQTIVEQQLMPFIDVKFASYKVLGSQVKKTSQEDRKTFVKAMYSNLVSTYSNALNQYTDQQVKFEQDKPVKGKKTAVVRAELLSPSQPTINMLFKVRKNKKTGQWKAYDLVVEGISLVDSKRAELAGLLRQHGVQYVAENVL